MRRAWLVLLAVCVGVAPLSAQRQLTADASVAVVQQTGIDASSAFSGGLTFDAFGDRAWFRTIALATIAGADRATGQGLIAGSLLGPLVNHSRWELVGTVGSFAETQDATSVGIDVFAGARFERGGSGTAIGLGTGAVGLRGNWSNVVRGQGDAWWRTTTDQAAASASFVHVPSAPQRILVDGRPLPVVVPARLSYFDGSVSGRHDESLARLSAVVGWRGMLEGEGGGAWASAEAAVWLTSGFAAVASAGRSLADPTRGVPRTTFAGLGVRIAPKPLSVGRSASRPAVVVVAIGDGRRQLEVRGIDAARLEVMGDFTDWKAVDLERAGGVWRASVAISSGLHRLALRADGGAWAAPPGLPHADDGLGGTVGLITVP